LPQNWHHIPITDEASWLGMSTSFALREIERLDPQRDHQRIVRLSYCYDFPMEAAIVSIVVLLRSFGTNDEFVYIIARFVFEPIAWNAQFGWRPYCAREKESLFLFWTAVGRRMHVRDMPETREALFLFMCRYAQAHCRPDPVNRRLYLSFREVLAGWFPAPVRPLVRWILPHALDHDLCDQLMLPVSADTARAAVRAVLCARGRLVSLLPQRTEPYPFRTSPLFCMHQGP
jgi:hypothetical protein